MKAVIQRVKHSKVVIEGKIHSQISKGLMVLVGITQNDTTQDVQWLGEKITKLRIFDDKDKVMNLCAKDVDAEIMIVSQFTLQASTKKGNRPSYINAAKPEISVPIYEEFVRFVSKEMNKEVKTGVFGADMQVELINDGPVTIVIDTKNKQ